MINLHLLLERFIGLRGIASLILLCILTSCSSNSKYEETLRSTHAAEKGQIAEYEKAGKIRDYVREKKLNGSIFVSVGKTLIFKGGNGYADYEKKVKNKDITTFPIASLTKMFVATSLLQLEEIGSLNLNDPIEKYIQGFPNGQKIKLIHLVSNTSGIQQPPLKGRIRTAKEMVNAIKNSPVRFPAGTHWDYQDVNYILLASIIEKVSGKSLHDYVKDNIFSKAGMQDSGFITRENPFPYTAKGYFNVHNHLKPINQKNIHLLYGAGDSYSTVEDINKFEIALLECKLFSKKFLDKMMTPRSKSHYGLGVYRFKDYFFSRGTLGGWNAVHVYFKDKTNVILLLNARTSKMDILKNAKEIHQLIKK